LKPFIVEANLASPIICGKGYLTLDAILGAAIFQRTNDPVASSNDIPLLRSHGVYHGSQAFLSAKSDTGGVNLVRKMGGDDIEPGTWIPNNLSVNKPWAFRIDKGDYCIKMNVRKWIASKNALWFGYGDIDHVRDLLRLISSVGAKRNHGWGAVDICPITNEFDWTVTECEVDCSHVLRGRPARPLPVNHWASLPDVDKDVQIGTESISLPVWAGKHEMCVLPDTQIVHLSTIKKIASPVQI
jgi:hypothetical protein